MRGRRHTQPQRKVSIKKQMLSKVKSSINKKINPHLVCPYCGKEAKSKSDFQFHQSIHPNEIMDNLYLGNSEHAKDLKLLQRMGITHVLNVAHDIPSYHTLSFTQYKHLRLKDEEDQPILPYFEEAFSFIDNAVLQTTHDYKILVHCHLGVSRSVAFVIGYLMSRLSLTLSESLKIVKSKRVVANPRNFFAQLEAFEKQTMNGSAMATSSTANVLLKTATATTMSATAVPTSSMPRLNVRPQRKHYRIESCSLTMSDDDADIIDCDFNNECGIGGGSNNDNRFTNQIDSNTDIKVHFCNNNKNNNNKCNGDNDDDSNKKENLDSAANYSNF